MTEGRGSRHHRLVKPVIVEDETYVDEQGMIHRHVDTSTMSNPAQCRGCGLTFDTGMVTVTARYADCSVWNCPGCGRTHDSRHAWTGAPGERMGYVDLNERRSVLTERGTRPWMTTG